MPPLSVIHITATDRGGAGAAASRINQALQQHGTRSDLSCLHPTQTSSLPLPLPQATSFLRQRVRMNLGRFLTPSRKDVWHSGGLLPSGLPSILNTLPYNLVHLHWPHDELMAIWEYSKIKKPVVWTLHDCWAFLPAAHYFLGRTIKEHLKFHPTAQLSWKLKQSFFPQLPWNLIVPSRAMKFLAERSGLFPDAEIDEIPHPLNATIFHPSNQESARLRLQLPLDQKIILFRYTHFNDSIKGGDLIQQTMRHAASDYFWLSFGEGKPEPHGTRWRHLGPIATPQEMAEIYAAADITLAPSREEAFGLVHQESIGCGTPVVALHHTGPASFITEHNGALVSGHAKEILAAMNQLLQQQWTPENKVQIASEIAALHNPEKIATEHINVYQKIFEGSKGRLSS